MGNVGFVFLSCVGPLDLCYFVHVDRVFKEGLLLKNWFLVKLLM